MLGRRPARLTAAQAAAQIPSGCRLLTVGFTLAGACESVLTALEQRFLATGEPRDLTLLHAAGQSDRERGIEHLAHAGLLRRVIGAHWGLAPRLSRLIQEGKVEAFCLPQGQLLAMLRAAAAGQPGHLTRIGLGTFVDPRREGGRMNAPARARPPVTQMWSVGGEEYLFYPVQPVDVALIRATTADEEGNLTCEEEPLKLEILAAALAARRFGGRVIAQVKRLARAGTLHPRRVIVPGIHVDALVVAEDPGRDHRQTSSFDYDPSFCGDLVAPVEATPPLPGSVRKLIGRRALLEVPPGSTVNLGTGIPGDTVGPIAEEEGLEGLTLTVESGVIGGVPSGGVDFGIARNPRALVEHTTQFDYYTGTGVDVCLMGAAEIDAEGNVNVSAFGDRVIGCGGFVDITQSARKVVFCSTFRVGQQEIEVREEGLTIRRDGPAPKFVREVGQVTFSGRRALAAGQQVVYVTERAVFRLTPQGLELVEVAPGVDLERDVLRQMDFAPKVREPVPKMPLALFARGRTGLYGAPT